MGEVYLAEDTRLGRRVALKLLPPEFTHNAERIRRFEREARAASALNHPNIVTIYEIGQSDGTYFIATELVEGQTLRDLMPPARAEIKVALNVIVQVADALCSRARRRDRSSRRQTRKHHAAARRLREGPRFRSGEIDRAGSR